MSPSVILRAEQLVCEYLKGHDASHDFQHVQRVRRNAERIMREEKSNHPEGSVNETVVVLAALFHDVGDFKYTKDFEVQRQHLSDIVAKISDQITAKESAQITQIVLGMSFRKELEGSSDQARQSVEFQIVQDADRLDAIGAIGLARCFAYSGATGAPILNGGHAELIEYQSRKDNAPLTAAAYNRATITGQGDSIGHVYEKLLRLSSMMKTQTGKRLSLERHQFMLGYLAQLAKELE